MLHILHNISVKGIIVGYLTLFLLAFIADGLWFIVSDSQATPESVQSLLGQTNFLIYSIVVGFFTTLLAAYVCGRIGSKAPYKNVAVLYVTAMILGVIFEESHPLWVSITDKLVFTLGSFLGGYFAAGKNKGIFRLEACVSQAFPKKPLMIAFFFASLFLVAYGLLSLADIAVALVSHSDKKETEDVLPHESYMQLLGDCPEEPLRFGNPLPSPLSDEKVIQWASSAPLLVLTLERKKFKDTLLEHKRFFTPTGWCAFIDVLGDMKFEKLVVDKKVSLSLQAHKEAKIVDKREAFGTHLWKTEMPVTLMFRPEDNNKNSEMFVKGMLAVDLLQVPFEQSSDGLAILHYAFIPSSPMEAAGDRNEAD